MKSPQVLELSGIGRSDVLVPLGIKTRLYLPGVGINMQEHMYSMVFYGMCSIALTLSYILTCLNLVELDSKYNFETLDCLQDEDYLKKQQEL